MHILVLMLWTLQQRLGTAEKKDLHIMGFFPMTGEVFRGGKACLLGSEMALRHINEREDILDNYKLNLIWRDSQVRGLNLLSLQSKADTYANSVDPDETARHEPSHQSLHCLQFCYWCMTKKKNYLQQWMCPNSVLVRNSGVKELICIFLCSSNHKYYARIWININFLGHWLTVLVSVCGTLIGLHWGRGWRIKALQLSIYAFYHFKLPWHIDCFILSSRDEIRYMWKQSRSRWDGS